VNSCLLKLTHGYPDSYLYQCKRGLRLFECTAKCVIVTKPAELPVNHVMCACVRAFLYKHRLVLVCAVLDVAVNCSCSCISVRVDLVA